MSGPKTQAIRFASLAIQRLTATDDQALDDARDYAVRLLTEIEAVRVRQGGPERIGVVLQRVLAEARKANGQ